MITDDVNMQDLFDDFVDTLCGKSLVDDNVSQCVSQIEHVTNTDETIVKSNAMIPSVEVEFPELYRIEIFIHGVECSVKCLEDIVVFRSELLDLM